MPVTDWVCGVCCVQNRAEDDACRVCGALNPAAASRAPKPAETVGWKPADLPAVTVEPPAEADAKPVPAAPAKGAETATTKKPKTVTRERRFNWPRFVRLVGVLWWGAVILHLLQWVTGTFVFHWFRYSPDLLLSPVTRFSAPVYLAQLAKLGQYIWRYGVLQLDLENIANLCPAILETAGNVLRGLSVQGVEAANYGSIPALYNGWMLLLTPLLWAVRLVVQAVEDTRRKGEAPVYRRCLSILLVDAVLMLAGLLSAGAGTMLLAFKWLVLFEWAFLCVGVAVMLVLWGFLERKRRWSLSYIRQYAVSLLVLLALSLLLFGL